MPINGGGSALSEDAHPITPFHDVLRSHGFGYAGSEHKGGERINRYEKPNEGAPDKVKITAGTKGNYGRIVSHVTSGDPEGREGINSSTEKMDRNIHAASYRTPKEIPHAMKASEQKAAHEFLKPTEKKAKDAEDARPTTVGINQAYKANLQHVGTEGHGKNSPFSHNPPAKMGEKTLSGPHEDRLEDLGISPWTQTSPLRKK